MLDYCEQTLSKCRILLISLIIFLSYCNLQLKTKLPPWFSLLRRACRQAPTKAYYRSMTGRTDGSFGQMAISKSVSGTGATLLLHYYFSICLGDRDLADRRAVGLIMQISQGTPGRLVCVLLSTLANTCPGDRNRPPWSNYDPDVPSSTVSIHLVNEVKLAIILYHAITYNL